MTDIASKTWELSPYEKVRKPQEAITNETEIAVSPRSLNSELMCPICLDILKNTMTTKECLHRFCAECITTAIRNSNKECPTCRKKLISKRSLRPDPNFDALISNIFPRRAEYEEMQEKVLAKLSKQSSTIIQQSIEEGIRRQALNRPFRPRNKRGGGNTAFDEQGSTIEKTDDIIGGGATTVAVAAAASDCDSESVTSLAESSSSSAAATATRGSRKRTALESAVSGEDMGLVKYAEIEFIVKPHPDLGPTAQTRFLRTAGNATLGHLSRYLDIRTALESNQSIPPSDGVSFRYRFSYVPGGLSIDSHISLDQLKTPHKTNSNLLELYYAPNT